MISIAIPVYNEETTIGPVLDAVMALELAKEVIVVDDASHDGTAAIVRAHPLRPTLESLPHNRGKGAAIRRAIQVSTGDIVVIQDADLELSASVITQLVRPIEADQADAVYGSRFLNGASLVPVGRRVVNRTLTGMANRLFGLQLTDVMTAHKAIRGNLARSLELDSSGFEVEMEITAKLARSNSRILEIASPYRPRTRAEGKKIRWFDTVKVLQAGLRHHDWRRSTRRARPTQHSRAGE